MDLDDVTSGFKSIPEKCPVCGESTVIKEDNGFKFLYCVNKSCPAKEIKKYTHFVGRNAMNIDGMSEETLEKFVDSGYIKEFADIYKLNRYEDEIVSTKGFGRKSFDNFITSINNSRDTDAYRIIFGLGIAGIGQTNAKMLCNAFDNDLDKLISADKDDEMKKAQGKFVKRLIAAALIFLIPLIIEFVLGKMGFGYNDCGLF